MWRSGEWSVGAVLQGVVIGLGGLLLQLAMLSLRRFVGALIEVSRELERLLHIAVTMVLAVCFAAGTLGRLGQGVLEKTGFALAGVSRDAWMLLVVALVAWAFASVRDRMESFFALLPLSELSGLSKVLFIAEAVWMFLGLVVALTFPWVGAALAVAAFALMGLAVLGLRRWAEGGRERCGSCGGSVHRAASVCARCQASRAPARLTVWGVPADGAPSSPEVHRLHLLAAHRCPHCAERIGRDLDRACASCGQLPLASAAARAAFVTHVDRRVAALTPAFAVLGLIPGFGLPLALLLFKLSPAGALSGYGEWTQALGTRVLRGLVLITLSLLQPLPLVGALAAVGLVTLLHLWSRRPLVTA